MLVAVIFLTCSIIFIYSRPIDWDSGACAGGYGNYIFEKYQDDLVHKHVLSLDNVDGIISAKPIQGSQSVSWDGKTIYLQFTIHIENRYTGITDYTIKYMGKRVWIDTYEWVET